MILVTVGTQVHDFKRLFNYLSAIETNEKIIVQYGHSSYNLNYESFAFNHNLHQYIKEADLIITHGGAGTIVEALKLNKKIITVPRLKIYNEHVDNHQEELCSKLANDNYLMEALDEESFKLCFNTIQDHMFKKYESNNKYFNEELTKEINKLIRVD